MKKLFVLIAFVYSWGGLLYAQMGNNPVKWHFYSKKLAPNQFELHFVAEIRNSWHIYAQETDKDISLPTSFSFNKNPLVEIVEKPTESGELIRKKEEVTGSIQQYYEDKVEFVQVVKLKADVKTNISGVIRYMSCTGQVCLPPANQSFSINLGE